MGLIDRFRRKREPGKDSPTPPAWVSYIDAMVIDTEAIRARWHDVTTAREVAKRIHGPALGCAMINAKVCASVPIRLYRPATGVGKTWRNWKGRTVTDVRRRSFLRDFTRVGRKAAMWAEQDDDVVEIMDHPILSLLQRPNPQRTGTEFEVERWTHRWMFGNNLCLKIPGSAGGIVALAGMMPQYIHVQPDNERLIAGYWFGRQDQEVKFFDAESVIHQRFMPHWHIPYWGMGPMDVVFRELDLYEFSLAAEQARWQNGGYPGGVLAMKNIINQDQLDQVTRGVEQRMKGVGKSGKLLVTTEGTYTQLGKTNEMGYLPGMEHIERRVEQEFGVPEALRRLNDANLASGQMGPDMYLRFTVAPALRMDAEQLTELLLPEFGIDPGEAWLVYDDVVPADAQAMREDTTSHVAAGVLTIDEQRAKMGMEPLPNGLGAISRVNGTPLDKVGQIPALGVPGTIRSDFPVVNGGGGGTPGTVQSDFPKVGETDKPAEAGTVEIPEQFKALRKSWGDSDPYYEPHTHVHTKDDDRLNVPRETVLEIERIVREWLEAAGRAVTADAIARGVTLAGMDQELEAALEPLVADLFRVGAVEGYASIGVTDADFFEVVPERALEEVRRHNSLIVEQIRGTTEDGIRAAIQEGVGQGLSSQQTQELVQSAVAEAAPHRAEAIARTETANAHMAGTQAAWREAGVERKQWLLAPDACSICAKLVERLEGKSIGIGEPFARAGEVIIGDDGRKYVPRINVMHPPLHPNDRCAMVADLGDE